MEESSCTVERHKLVESSSLLAQSKDFERSYAWWIIGEPFGKESKDEICLDQVQQTAEIYVISDDGEWAEDIRSKVVKCRPGAQPKKMSMTEAMVFFGPERTPDWTHNGLNGEHIPRSSVPVRSVFFLRQWSGALL